MREANLTVTVEADGPRADGARVTLESKLSAHIAPLMKVKSPQETLARMFRETLLRARRADRPKEERVRELKSLEVMLLENPELMRLGESHRLYDLILSYRDLKLFDAIVDLVNPKESVLSLSLLPSSLSLSL